MTEVIVSLVFENVKKFIKDHGASNLGQFVMNQVGSALEVEKDLTSLASTFSAIQTAIEDAERKQIKSKSVKNWLKKLKDVAYDIEDILDDWKTGLSKSREEDLDGAASGKKRKVREDLFHFGSNCINNITLSNRIKEITERLDRIAKEKSDYQFSEVGEKNSSDIEGRQTSSFIEKEEAFGRETEKEEIISWLVADNDEGLFAPAAIVAMGGLGKTTLAQLVFNDERVKKHFHKRLWVCVSENFSTVGITRDMVENGSSSPFNFAKLDPLQQRLSEMLSGKRFLLILDDVWNENSEKWDTLKRPLRSCSDGSKIVVTTRSERVAKAMDITTIWQLKGLPDETCWQLFRRRAFMGRSDGDLWKLEEIGREISKKCKGVPLTVKTIASMMRHKTKKEQWELVLRDRTWDLEEMDVLPALLLSYYDLSPVLKRCFAYCSMFPKDYRIPKHELKILWAAEGFVQAKETSDIMTKANEYIDELVSRSLIHNSESGTGKEQENLILHDLVHDLAMYVSGEDGIGLTAETEDLTEIISKTRHAFVAFWNSTNGSEALFPCPPPSRKNNLRTLKFLARWDLGESGWRWLSTLFSYSKNLKVLDLTNCRIVSLPDTVGKLEHLRHLILVDTCIKTLPDTVGSLGNLENLNLTKCNNLEILPPAVTKLTSLRHLLINDTISLKSLPRGIGKLRRLETLSRFVLGSKPDECGIEELGDLNNLLELNLENLEMVKSENHVANAELQKKKRLQSMKLACVEPPVLEVDKTNKVFEELKPPENIQKLHIDLYMGIIFPSWMDQPRLLRLVSVTLSNCYECEQLPSLGQLPCLRYLKMIGMRKLTHIGEVFYGEEMTNSAFPRLQKLIMKEFPRLEKWLIYKKEMPSLYKLKISSIANLKVFPFKCLPSLRKLCLENASHKILDSVPDLPNLVHLRISGFEDLRSLPNGLRRFETVKKFLVERCSVLESLNERFLTSLTGLVSLSIMDCENLSFIPDCLKSMISLQSLHITGCPCLKERCVKVAGKDWGKIAHIKTIVINGQTVQGVTDRDQHKFHRFEENSQTYLPLIERGISNSDMAGPHNSRGRDVPGEGNSELNGVGQQ